MKLLRVGFLFIFFSLNGCAVGADKSITECAGIYHTALQNVLLQDPAKLAGFLNSNSAGCIQYDEFNVWLSAAYQEAGNYEKSVEVAKKALATAVEYKPNLLQVIAEAELQTGSLDEAFKQAEQISKEFPSYAPILGMLSEISVKRRDWNAALVYGQKAYALEKNINSLLMMIGPLGALDKDEEVIETFNKILELEPDRISRENIVIETIFSLVALNRREEARDLARRHIAANPNWRNDPTFARAAFELGATKDYSPLP